ncbi:hypothetical protein AKJ51_02445 [candidate division MSBL1 archaeon SCGC-AAA382A20]|uniref:Uncharacterized protein n=1 Tax=candidate division MSBL1 archaeon SCGC-AAA382A20 TaxID=1698280 RepID=A0A133VKI6_9EURY|nr:hypothetical protein AKJ51_02445 [candidate division MSBL1 archaeon SCGC-AAA382A20]
MTEVEEMNYYQLRELYDGDDHDSEFEKLKLKCKDCNYRGTVKEMRILKNKRCQQHHILRKEREWRNREKRKSSDRFSSCKESIAEYDENFNCPNCGSDSIKLLPEEIDKITAQAL